jgi:ankyrin repeat protein
MAVRKLPAHPSLEQYKKQAKELLKSCRSGDSETLRRMKESHRRLDKVPDSALPAKVTLSGAQLVLAREHGFESWHKLAKHIEELAGEPSPATLWRLTETALIAGDVPALESLLHHYGERIRGHQPSHDDPLAPDYQTDDAHKLILSMHQFETWDQFAAHTESLEDRSSPTARFEAAADAIVNGEVATLETLLHRNPELVRARSTRKHHSTLLHYVGANGVEAFRQRTPKNAVQVVEALLRAGAEVDAVAGMYGGTTALGLVATSIHPVRTGVQGALIDSLLDHGASLDRAVAPDYTDGSLVNACLANGRGEAAEFLVSRGAPLDLEGAAGVGRLDIVKSFFEEDGSLKPAATTAQMKNGFARACSYGRTDVVEFLLDHGMEVGAPLPRHGMRRGHTALHVAALGGHGDSVKALLRRHAPVDAKDDFGTTPLTLALTAWGNHGTASPGRYYQVVALLVAAGAKVDGLASEKARDDPQMLAALRGETLR